jgi:hypothetical protein
MIGWSDDEIFNRQATIINQQSLKENNYENIADSDSNVEHDSCYEQSGVGAAHSDGNFEEDGRH